MSIFNVFVQNPALIALISGIFFGAYLLLRGNTALRSRALLVPATAWLLWAVWELAITLFSPEANIRVDLLLVIPVVLIAAAYDIIMLFVKPRSRQ